MPPLPSPLLAVTDRHGHPRLLAETARRVFAGGGRWLWFRDRDLSGSERRAIGADLAALAREAGALLSVGADPDLAAAIGAGGVHLPGPATAAAIGGARAVVGPEGLVGVSAHAPHEIEAARAGGADYVTLSPIFPSASKPGYGPALGLEGIARAARIGLPVVALGGVETGTAAACRAAGAAGIAVMGGLMRTDDPSSEVEALLRAWTDRAPARGASG